MTLIALLAPPVLLLRGKPTWLAFTVSVLIFWGTMYVGAQYHLAYTSDYDSIAPGLALFGGWIPATAYTTCWLLLIRLVKQ